MSNNSNKKPVKINFEHNLVASVDTENHQVKIKNQAAPAVEKVLVASNNNSTTLWRGCLKIRRETKHRGGHPVLVLHSFTNPFPSEIQLKNLCIALKNQLACGGSISEGEIIIQQPNFEKLQKVLEKLQIKSNKL